MTILEQLNKWSEKTGGNAETVSTITLSTEQMNLVVHGVSLEDAYDKIKEICSDFKEEEPATTETIPESNKVELNKLDLNIASTKTLAEALGDKKIVKIYTPGTALEKGESIISFQNTQYVVK